ncbi:MAG: hypothetical protein CVT64_03135 [Actinobacteria bacterium HGW-Actinobacteria-4]|nr:MAG: hypothetical protein CVT64_03135 [Actinobacteria bacterium HGW-Actinobacteria-4]
MLRPATARGPWNFLALLAFVVLGTSYTMVLAGMYSIVDPTASGRIDPLLWASIGAVSLFVMVVARRAAKSVPRPSSPHALMRDWAWNTAASYSSASPTGALVFDRPPLSVLRVARSGPSVVNSVPASHGVTMVRASLDSDDGGSHSIGSYVAWCEVGGVLPPLSLVRGDVKPALWGSFGSDELDLAEYDLIFDWRGFGSVEACADVLRPGMVKFLNSVGDKGLALQFEPNRVVVWSDQGASLEHVDRFRAIATSCAAALPRHLREGGSQPSRASGPPSRAAESLDSHANLGELRSMSKIRSRLRTAFLVFGLLALPPIVILAVYLLNGYPFIGDGKGLLATGIVIAVVVATAGPGWVSEVAMKRLDARHRKIALEVRDLASDANLVFSPRARFLEEGWTRRPFATLKNLGAAPSASAYRAWGAVGVSYIEGDVGAGGLLVKPFQSRVSWAQVSGGLPRMDFVREGFASRAAKLIGGTDLDTESFAFNQLWRIKTDDPQESHALLQPLMIEFLTATAEQGIAIHLDGDRVVIWDDGTDQTIDLAARLTLVERFVDCLPGHLRPTGNRDQEAL